MHESVVVLQCSSVAMMAQSVYAIARRTMMSSMLGLVIQPDSIRFAASERATGCGLAASDTSCQFPTIPCTHKQRMHWTRRLAMSTSE